MALTHGSLYRIYLVEEYATETGSTIDSMEYVMHMSTRETNQACLIRHLTAENGHRLEETLATLTADCLFEDILKLPPPQRGACPDRAPPRAAGLQAAPADGGGARGGPPAPRVQRSGGGGCWGGRGGVPGDTPAPGGRRGRAAGGAAPKGRLNFLSAARVLRTERVWRIRSGL
jgi:hypothetical protein